MAQRHPATGAGAGAPDTGFPLQALVRAVLDDEGARDWTAVEDGFWCRVGPEERDWRLQGWKLHLSATPLSAPEVLHRATRVLVRGGCPFKFAARAEHVEELTGIRYDRAQCGKFVTAYPEDDDHLRALAAALDEATAGLPGPRILSDRPYRPGSLVHYRYGAFLGVPHVTHEGVHQARLATPDGGTVEDVRNPWFSPPSWAELPFPGAPGRPAQAPAAPRTVLLHDRYAVHDAIRHSARGGVYRAVDRRTGDEVIVKEARAHVGSWYTGLDARDALRAEAAALTALSGLGPELVEVFDQDGHTFLVETVVPGTTLARWTHERFAELADVGTGLPVALVRDTARRLADLLGEVHGRGLVFRDFTPNNVMVTPDGPLRLIDPEFAARPGTWDTRAYTPGHGAPEYVAGPKYRQVPGPAVDLFALGATLHTLATGTGPAFAPDRPDGARTVVERLDGILALAAPANAAARFLAPAVRGLCAEDPEARWTLERFVEHLDTVAEGAGEAGRPGVGAGAAEDAAPAGDAAGAGSPADGTAAARGSGARTGADADASDGTTGARPARRADADGLAATVGRADGPAEAGRAARGAAPAADPTGTPRRAADPAPLRGSGPRTGAADADPVVERLLDDGLAHLLGTAGGPDADRLWASSAFGQSTDRVNVQHGSAGVLALLTRADALLDRPALRDAVAATAVWTDARSTPPPDRPPLPGLYFGRAGTAWALYDAARHLGDDVLADRAGRLALALPPRWGNPDVFHGAAGAGLTQLRFWRATGRPDFLDRAADCADGLLAAAAHHDDGVFWPVPHDFDSRLAGITHLGYAHGVAGVGAFLLEAALATGRADLLDTARAAGRTLVDAAERGTGGARWRTDRTGAQGTGMLHHLCSGSSGVGTFLIRLWQATGDPDALALAEEAATAVHRARWTSGSAVCHGLAGNGDFLLDLADALDADARGGPYRDMAADLALALHSRHVLYDGLALLPDESGLRVTSDYGVGLAGALSFLLRLRHGGPRLLLDGTGAADTAAAPGGPAPVSAALPAGAPA
ncbi:lanthionine synthetase LanC family protein [Streptomyces sp. NPDC058417]|uniref:class III lanthionine synthetase LanKC N-terminal domain-containing protein n=3 Tax=Streptomyces TaxID=1883 RepID=UPI0036670C6D